MSGNSRSMAAARIRGLGLTPSQANAALKAAEHFAEATGLDIDTADEAIFRSLQNFSPKPQRPSPHSPW